MYAILFAMAVKPTSDDGWVIVFGAAVLVVLSAVFLAPLRGGAPAAPPRGPRTSHSDSSSTRRAPPATRAPSSTCTAFTVAS